jgi:dipeptidase D
MSDDGKVVVTISSRSAVDSQLDMSVRGIDLLARACGAVTNHHSRYPGWDFSGESAMANEFISVFDELYGIKVEKNIIHAGLECGVIKSALGELDCISCGPTVLDLHSPNEALDIESMGRYAYAVYTMLKNAK